MNVIRRGNMGVQVSFENGASVFLYADVPVAAITPIADAVEADNLTPFSPAVKQAINEYFFDNLSYNPVHVRKERQGTLDFYLKTGGRV